MTLSQIADDDFLTLLQKQFPTDVQIPFDLSFPGYNNPTAVNPQNLSDYTLPISQPTPSSSDSGNSPISTTNDNDDRSLKRKASDERMDVEPASKTAHTAALPSTTASSGNSNKKTNTRRKSGNPTQDELRLLKRKEQNRAAQRAFRERKEKHVKDLEDKVAELELKNQRTESENENLRDLLTRLQEENVQLKKKKGENHHSSSQPFTFAISKDSPATVGNTINSPLQKDSPSASSTLSSVPPQTNFLTPFTGSEFDFGSLIPFDPAVLSTLDDTYTSPSVSEDAMNLDFGFGKPNRQTFNILASDPAYMSFAEPSPPDSTSVSTPMNTINPFDFSALDQWSRSGPRSGGGDNMQTFDELFGGGSFLSSSSGIDFAELMKRSPSLMASSPVSHTILNGESGGTSNVDQPLSSPSTNSPETSHHRGSGGCPKTKEQLLETINKGGLSSFVVDSPGNNSPSTQCETNSIPFLKKSTNKDAPMVMCRGSSFPKTEQNDKNIEVLSAWRSITSNPQFKDIDINDLCTEFTNKAKCDGTKVVLEPSGVSHIIDTLTAKVQQKAAAATAANK